jgi:hypothetical protein
MMEVVLKPITDGIKGYVRGIANAVEDYVEGYGDAEDVISALFGPFANVLKAILSITEAVYNLIKPFLDLVSSLFNDAKNFVIGIISGTLGGDKNAKHASVDKVKNNKNNSDYLLNYIKKMLGLDSESEGKGDEWTGLEKTLVVLEILNLFPAITLAAYKGGTGKPFAAIWGLVLSTAGLLCSLFSYEKPIYLSVISIVLGFAGLITTSLGFVKNSLSGNTYADGLLLIWGGICCAVSSLNGINNLREEGAI